MKKIFLFLTIFFIKSSVCVSQNYIGLNIGVGADKITTKSDNYYLNLRSIKEGYKTYHRFYGLRFESNFSKHFGFSFNSNFAQYFYEISTRGIVPINGIRYQLLRSSFVFKYAPIKQIYVGAGISSTFERSRIIYSSAKLDSNYGDFVFSEINSIFVLGTKLNHFLLEFYWINANIYQSKTNKSGFDPFKSIGVSASYLIKLPERNKKKGAEYPKF